MSGRPEVSNHKDETLKYLLCMFYSKIKIIIHCDNNHTAFNLAVRSKYNKKPTSKQNFLKNLLFTDFLSNKTPKRTILLTILVLCKIIKL